MVQNIHRSACKQPVILIRISPRIFPKYTQISNFMKIQPMKAKLFHVDGRTDRHTDITKLIYLFFRNLEPRKRMFIKNLSISKIEYNLYHLTNPCILRDSTVLISNSQRHDSLQLHTFRTKVMKWRQTFRKLEERSRTARHGESARWRTKTDLGGSSHWRRWTSVLPGHHAFSLGKGFQTFIRTTQLLCSGSSSQKPLLRSETHVIISTHSTVRRPSLVDKRYTV